MSMEKMEKSEYIPSGKIKKSVMDRIKEGKVKMRRPDTFLAEELGLKSALAAVMLFGAFLFSVILYFLKKTGAVEFLGFGISGLKIFLKIMPYDYIALFLAAVLVGRYLLQKMDLDRKIGILPMRVTAFLLLVVSILGIFFAYMSAGQITKGVREINLPPEALFGKIVGSMGENLIVQEGNGKEIEVFFKGKKTFKNESAMGKFLWAVGQRQKDAFWAEKISCCYE